jgi:hypothetical protein
VPIARRSAIHPTVIVVSARKRAGRFERASKYAGQLLQAKLFKGTSATTSFARAGFKWT